MAVVFSPEPSQRLVGRVNKIGVDYIGILVHSLFNASIVSRASTIFVLKPLSKAADNMGKLTYDATEDVWTDADDPNVVAKLGTLVLFELVRCGRMTNRHASRYHAQLRPC